MGTVLFSFLPVHHLNRKYRDIVRTPYIVLYSTVQYCTVHYCMVLYYTVHYCTVQYSKVQYRETIPLLPDVISFFSDLKLASNHQKSLKQTQPYTIFKGIFQKTFKMQKKNYKKNKTWQFAEQKKMHFILNLVFIKQPYV